MFLAVRLCQCMSQLVFACCNCWSVSFRLLSTVLQVLLSLLQHEMLAMVNSSAFHTLTQACAMHHGSNGLNGRMVFIAHVTCALSRWRNQGKSKLQQQVVICLMHNDACGVERAIGSSLYRCTLLLSGPGIAYSSAHVQSVTIHIVYPFGQSLSVSLICWKMTSWAPQHNMTFAIALFHTTWHVVQMKTDCQMLVLMAQHLCIWG